MKTITIKPVEFHNFQELANQNAIKFTYQCKGGKVEIKANAEQLEELGY